MDEFTKLSDEKIVEKVRSENNDIYSIIIDRYQDKLLRYAVNLVKDSDQASHIVQDSLVKAYINLNGFNVKKKFSSWIYRIVHNEAMNSLKKYKKEVKMPEDFDIDSEQDLEREFEENELIIYIGKCLELIPLMYSEPLNLYYLEDRSYQEISDILKIPIGTVATRINRAKKLMKHICQKK